MADDASTFAPAGTQELLRAHQRDQEQQSQLTALTRDVARSVFGERSLLDKGPIVDLLSSLAYYSLTFGRGSQTLGEEYVDVIPVTGSAKRSSVSLRRRRLALLLSILIPYGLPLLTRYLRSLRVFSDPPEGDDETAAGEGPQRWWSRGALVRTARRALAHPEAEESLGLLAGELGLALFFLRGGPLEWGKRLAGIRYISTLPPPEQDDRSSPRYKLIGLLLLFPILRRLAVLLLPRLAPAALSTAVSPDGATNKPAAAARAPYSLPSGPLPLAADPPPAYPTPSDVFALEPDERTVDQRKCTLCLETWSAPAVTECGHVFCWACIVGWSAEKEECPLCRQELNPSRLQPVYNL